VHKKFTGVAQEEVLRRAEGSYQLNLRCGCPVLAGEGKGQFFL